MGQLTISDGGCMLVASSVAAVSFEYFAGPGAAVTVQVAKLETRRFSLRFFFGLRVVYAARTLNVCVSCLLVPPAGAQVADAALEKGMGLSPFLLLEINCNVETTAAETAAANAARTEPRGSYTGQEMRWIRQRPVSATYPVLGHTRCVTALSHYQGPCHALGMQSAFYVM